MVKNSKSPSFETAVSELESIVQEMENGQLPLDQALAAYQRGTLLLKQCQDLLSRAEQSIRVIEATSPEGTHHE